MIRRKSPGLQNPGDLLKRQKKRRVISVVVGSLLLFVSLALIAYPFISNAYYEYYDAREAEEYLQEVQRTESTVVRDALDLARAYNTALAEGGELPAAYEDVLNLSGTGVMGYVDIPKLGLSLPILHGSDPDTLQSAVGHLSDTALPVGGKGTHCVITGHSGLASKRLFSDLDEMKIGDIFYLDILGEKICYRVDNISVILPYELDALAATPGKDYCTLVTCTPFGINTHRLLVRGERVEESSETSELSGEKSESNPKKEAEETTKGSFWVRKYITALLFCFGVIAIIVIVIVCVKRYRDKRKKKEKEEKE